MTVTAVCPGPTASEFASPAKMIDTRVFWIKPMSPRAVVRFAYRALRKKKRVAIPGFWNRTGVLLSRYVPRRLSLKFAEFIMSRKS